MRYRLIPVVLAVVWGAALPCPAPACSLCLSFANMQTLRHDVERAGVVIYGTAANPRFHKSADARPGAGVTDFHILQVIKPHPTIPQKNVVELDRYIPVLDDKNPPKYVFFCEVTQGKLDPYSGRSVTSPALLPYLQGAMAQQTKPRVQALLFFFDYLDHEDADVAADAFLEFAKANDDEVAQVGKLLPPERLRKLMLNPKTPPERLTLLAVLLGSAGHSQDVQLLERMIDYPDGRTRGALDGLLCGYIQLNPQAGWDKVMGILANERRPFPERLAASRVLKFYQNAKPVESRPQIVRGMKHLVAGDLADIGIDDLRRWEIWDLTAEVLQSYGKANFDAPITRRAIVRYALCCPLPDSRRFVEQIRRQEPQLLQELEEALQYERQYANK